MQTSARPLCHPHGPGVTWATRALCCTCAGRTSRLPLKRRLGGFLLQAAADRAEAVSSSAAAPGRIGKRLDAYELIEQASATPGAVGSTVVPPRPWAEGATSDSGEQRPHAIANGACHAKQRAQLPGLLRCSSIW